MRSWINAEMLDKSNPRNCKPNGLAEGIVQKNENPDPRSGTGAVVTALSFAIVE
jgi:hypothetical protein